MAILEEMIKLEKEIEERKEKIKILSNLREAYPDIKRHVNRWSKVRYASKSINDKADRFEIGHNCGCCNDSPVEVWPYIETENGRVYSDPPCYRVGEMNPLFYGDVPYPNWDKEMKENNISQDIINGVEKHFKQCKEDALDSLNGAYEDVD